MLVMFRSPFFQFLRAGAFLMYLSPAVVQAQPDPLVLQQQSIKSIDGVVAHINKFGEKQSHAGVLEQARDDLNLSNHQLALRGNLRALARGLINQGRIYRLQGKRSLAIQQYREALGAARRAGDWGLQSESLAWKARCESENQELGQALVDATEAVRLAKLAGSKDQQSHALDELAHIQMTQGDLKGAAITISDEFAAAAQATDPMAMLYALQTRRAVLFRLGTCANNEIIPACKQSLDEAIAVNNKVMEILHRLGHSSSLASARNMEKIIKTQLDVLSANERADKAIQKPFTVLNPKDHNLVSEQFYTPKIDKYTSDLIGQVSQKIQEMKRYNYDAEDDYRTLSLKGDIKQYEGDETNALNFYLQALDMLERDRRKTRDESSRISIVKNNIQYYEKPILAHLQRRQYADAFALLERSRARGFADLLSSRRLDFQRPAEQKYYAEAMLLRTQIGNQQTKLFELTSQHGTTVNRAKIISLQESIQKLEAKHQSMLSRMASEAPQLQKLLVSTPASLHQLQQSMREENYELFQYQVLESKFILWHITSDSIFVRSVFLPRLIMKSKLVALQQSIADRHTPYNETYARELFLYLIQPALSRIRSDRIVIIPDGDLNNLPFQVLQDPADGRFLGERFQLTYAPSVSVHLGLKSPKGHLAGRLLAVGEPSIGAAGLEVNAIAKLFPDGASMVITDGARKEEIRERIANVDVVHLALHGKFDASEPMLSHLSLAPSSRDEDRLTAAEMFALPLDNSQLVVLSGCETGRGEAIRGNEIQGMARALIYAGAPSIVLSKWRVDSEATALWMRTFYQSAMSKSIPAAARDALTTVKANPAFRHPYYWAAFTVIGR
jgi:CHAT domain-containing protein